MFDATKGKELFDRMYDRLVNGTFGVTLEDEYVTTDDWCERLEYEVDRVWTTGDCRDVMSDLIAYVFDRGEWGQAFDNGFTYELASMMAARYRG